MLKSFFQYGKCLANTGFATSSKTINICPSSEHGVGCTGASCPGRRPACSLEAAKAYCSPFRVLIGFRVRVHFTARRGSFPFFLRHFAVF